MARFSYADSIWKKMVTIQRESGFFGLASRLITAVYARCMNVFLSAFARVFLLPARKKWGTNRQFSFDNQTYDYLLHHHNLAWRNERTVEVPIAQRLLADTSPADTLEVGAVLQHYMPVSHTVVDKYEHGHRIINADICDVAPGRHYKRIISISTIEHVGFDEASNRPQAALDALNRMQDLLSPGGRMLVTWPAGYNSFLDSLATSGRLSCSRLLCMKRLKKCTWKQVEVEQMAKVAYGNPFPRGNGLYVALW